MLACKLCVFQGIRTSLAKKPYIYVIFQVGGGGPNPCPPPLDLHKGMVMNNSGSGLGPKTFILGLVPGACLWLNLLWLNQLFYLVLPVGYEPLSLVHQVN